MKLLIAALAYLGDNAGTGPYFAPANIAQRANGAVSSIRAAIAEQACIEAAARNALQLIMTLRDSTPNEVLDLLTNNGGEDVEAELAAALGVDLTESEDLAPRYIVDGHEFDDEESAFMGDGQYAPFVVFDSEAQDNLPGEYPTREEAQKIADEMNAKGGN